MTSRMRPYHIVWTRSQPGIFERIDSWSNDSRRLLKLRQPAHRDLYCDSFSLNRENSVLVKFHQTQTMLPKCLIFQSGNYRKHLSYNNYSWEYKWFIRKQWNHEYGIHWTKWTVTNFLLSVWKPASETMLWSLEMHDIGQCLNLFAENEFATSRNILLLVLVRALWKQMMWSNIMKLIWSRNTLTTDYRWEVLGIRYYTWMNSRMRYRKGQYPCSYIHLRYISSSCPRTHNLFSMAFHSNLKCPVHSCWKKQFLEYAEVI